jgi:hypothetical protein
MQLFYHIGGVMMENEQKRRCWEDDPPGWYLRSGDWFLHGPYETRELAQSICTAQHEECREL